MNGRMNEHLADDSNLEFLSFSGEFSAVAAATAAAVVVVVGPVSRLESSPGVFLFLELDGFRIPFEAKK